MRAVRQLRALVLTALALLIIITAILVGVGRALIPHADQLRPWLEATASERLGQRVTLERVEAEWPRLTPSLSLIGVQLDDGTGNRLHMDRVRLELHLPNALDRRSNLIRLVVLGLELILEPDEDGRWGAQLGAGAAGDWRQQLPLGDLLIRDAMVRVRPLQWPEILLQLDEGRVERRGRQTQFHGALSRPGGVDQLDLRLLIDHPDGQWASVRGWLGIRDLTLPALAASTAANQPPPDLPGRIDLQVWLDWALAEDRLALDLELIAEAHENASPLRALARLDGGGGAYQFEIEQLQQGDAILGSGLAVAWRQLDDRAVWAAAADALDLAPVHAALEPWLGAGSYWPTALGGRIEQLVMGFDDNWSLHAAGGRIVDLNLQMVEPLPGIAGLTLDLGLDGDRLVLMPSGQPTARWRRHIRADMEMDGISGRLLLAPGSIEIQGLAVDSPVAMATAHGWVYLRRPRPFLDFMIEVDRVGPIDPRPYLSYRTIPEPAMNWLDEAFVWVERASGLVNLHLLAGTRARDLHAGSYQALVDFQGAQLDYWTGWPRADAIDGQVAFVGNRLSGTVERARFGPVELAAPALEIASLTEPTMTVEISAGSVDAQALASVLADIPAPGWQAVLEPLAWSGHVDARTALVLPFRTLSDWQIEGEIHFDETAIGLQRLALGFDALSGTVAFDRRGISPAVLQARLPGQRFDLDIAADFEAPASLVLNARFNPAGLGVVRETLGPLAQGLEGSSRWEFRLQGDEPDGQAGLHLGLTSDLQGLALNWPPPLDKPAVADWPSSARLQLRADRQTLEFDLGERLAGQWVGADGIWSLTAGTRPLPEMPDQGIRVGGYLDHVALGDWLAYLGDVPGEAAGVGSDAFDLALEVGRLELPAVTAAPAEVVVRREVDGWAGQITSPELAGSVLVPLPLDSGRAMVVDLRRLHMERAPAQDEPVPPSPETISTLDPRGWPPLSLAVEDLRWGELILGRARLEAHPVDQGLEIELADVSGTDLRLQGRGRWIGAEAGPESQFTGRLTSPRLGALVRASGYEAGLEAARAQVDLDVVWPGAPYDFALRRLTGSLDLRLNDGEIPEARPGAGRLLGLASFSAIPRRLMLDFRDVFAAGLRFDDVDGRFELADGVASTDGLVLRSTAAIITISGQTDMAARSYDQSIVVEPGLGATLPVIGGLAGGPVGAAAGLVLRQLLDRPLRGLAEARYQVTGPWEAPEIELVAARLPDEPVDDDAARTPPP